MEGYEGREKGKKGRNRGKGRKKGMEDVFEPVFWCVDLLRMGGGVYWEGCRIQGGGDKGGKKRDCQSMSVNAPLSP